MTLSMSFTLCAGFVLTDAVSGNFVLVLPLSAAFQAVLYLLAWRRSATVIGIVGGAVIAALAIWYVNAYDPLADESANSFFIFLLLLFVSGLLIFLLGRSRAGCIVAFAAGLLLAAGARFLQFPAPGWSYFAYLISAALLYLLRAYAVSLKTAALGHARLPRYALQSLVAVLLAAAVAVAAFFAVVAPLRPPTRELRLVTQLKSMEILQVLGVSGVNYILDPAQTSAEEPEETEYDRDAAEVPGEPEQPETPEAPETPETEHRGTGEAQAVRYRLPVSRLILILVILLILIPAALPFLRRWRRRRWHERVRELGHDDAVRKYYPFFLKRLGRAGIPREARRTLREYAADNAYALSAYAAEDAGFDDLTRAYEKVLYGGEAVTAEEYDRFERFYEAFYPNLRRELGFFKYHFRMFRF